jgi:hypothetical protein
MNQGAKAEVLCGADSGRRMCLERAMYLKERSGPAARRIHKRPTKKTKWQRVTVLARFDMTNTQLPQDLTT